MSDGTKCSGSSTVVELKVHLRTGRTVVTGVREGGCPVHGLRHAEGARASSGANSEAFRDGWARTFGPPEVVDISGVVQAPQGTN